jgi:maltose alpha-D-glucosyltransferase/alpha-amylase
LELKNGIGDLLEASNRHVLETEILPLYLKNRRWFASKDQAIQSVRLAQAGLATSEAGELLLCDVEVELPAKVERYQLPLGLGFSDRDTSPLVETLRLVDATVAGENCTLTDAFSLDLLPTLLLQAMKTGNVIKLADGEIRFISLEGFDAALPKDGLKINRLSAEQSNSSLVIGGSMIMKLIRRVMHGINPEVEMVRYLTEHNYAHTPPLLGEVQNLQRDGLVYSMYVVQRFIANQGDAWGYTLGLLRAEPAELRCYRGFAAAVGTRLAELHEVLSRRTTDDAFSPREVIDEDVMGWTGAAERQLKAAFDVLESSRNLTPTAAQDRDFALAHRQEISAAIPNLARSGIGSLITRIHGDFHLGQVLVSDGDAYIIDFEGEPSKPLDIRRAKASPMRDVAGLLRSLHYAVSVSGASSTDFVTEMSAVVLNAYRTVLDHAPRRWVEGGDQQMQLLDLFLLEKCAYEICYEAANRPEWLAIPLRGLVEIVARILSLSEITDA